MRFLGGFICGVLAGFLLRCSITAGMYYRFPEEMPRETWGMLWGEHWFIRTAISIICTAWGGFIVGLITRKKGGYIASFASLPSLLLWAGFAFIVFAGINFYSIKTQWVQFAYIFITGINPFSSNTPYEFYVSIGNKISIGIILLATLPVSWYTGLIGEQQAHIVANHFDSRSHTLLGIKWYHYFWIPILLHFILMQASYAGFYFLVWLKVLWKSAARFNLFSYVIPGIFTMGVYATLYLMAKGVFKAYEILAGFETVESKGKAFWLVLKYALGYQIIATICQAGIQSQSFS